MQRVIAKFKRLRRIQAWQRALACSTALALLTSLLWLAPWQGRHDGPAPVPQPIPLQGSDRTAEEAAQPSAQPLAAPTPEAGPLPSAPAPQNPEQAHTSASSEESPEVLDTQAMQGLVTRLETARRNSGELLDTRAMDRLLARLASADKAGSAPIPGAKMARRRGSKALPRVRDRVPPGSVSPPRADSAALNAASGIQLPDAAR